MFQTPDEPKPEITSTATSVTSVIMETGRSCVSLMGGGRQLPRAQVSLYNQTVHNFLGISLTP